VELVLLDIVSGIDEEDSLATAYYIAAQDQVIELDDLSRFFFIRLAQGSLIQFFILG